MAAPCRASARRCYEAAVYDGDSGQLITGSLMDYCLPRADDVPFFAFRYNEIPTKANPLGVKGAGEAGAIGAPPAVINALVDALSPTACGISTCRRRRRKSGASSTARARGRPPSDRIRIRRACCRTSSPSRARRAMTVLRFYHGDHTVRRKADASPVTEADEASEAIILAGLKRLTPDVPAISEEAVAARRRRVRSRGTAAALLARRPGRRHQGVRRPHRRVHDQYRPGRERAADPRHPARAAVWRDLRRRRSRNGASSSAAGPRSRSRPASRRQSGIVALASRSHGDKAGVGAIPRRLQGRRAQDHGQRHQVWR